jgi:hypothetical protein
MVRHFGEAPPVLNLFEPELPTKRELLARLRATNPDLTVVWLPPVILLPLSWFAIAVQKVLRPRSPALNVAKIFARLRYDTSRIAGLAPAIRADTLRTQSSEPDLTLAAAHEPEVFAALASPARQLAQTR